MTSTMFVDRSIKIVPLGFDRDVRLMDAPRRTDGSRRIGSIASHTPEHIESPIEGSSNVRH
jgi:hypothetical protein